MRLQMLAIQTTIAALLLLMPNSYASSPLPLAPAPASAMKVHALRLRPDQDLFLEIKEFARREKLKAGVILTCVGSLKTATIRFANQPQGTEVKGPVEIVSLVGTITDAGGHIHLSVSDKEGRTLGGHLMDGSKVFTTAEIAVGELESLEFSRELDPISTFKELVVRPRKSPSGGQK